jgi:hypothetical protein
MSRISSAALAVATLVVLSTPVFAQGSSMGSAGGAGMNTSDSMPMTCQGMMDKAHPMMDNMANGNKKTMAMRQMDMANTAMSAGKEKTCMSHMKSAMKGMM